MAVPDDAAYAANWRRILLTDAALGVAAVLIGVRRGGLFHLVAVAGVGYVAAVFRRFLRWRRLRQERLG
ncbi:MAG: hypothetical protein QOK43_2703 [Acidimicrobiaceae bacterium]|jgi:hypothetical protein|nr:hypothetical protein [Acidimicrobiaceae bacterium]MDQ1443816.1 hypothetical protein [Acidimicrobiaceae bacterium]